MPSTQRTASMAKSNSGADRKTDDPVLDDPIPSANLVQLAQLLRSSQKIVVVSGSAISANAGFPNLQEQTDLNFALLSSPEKSAEFYSAVGSLSDHLEAESTQPTLLGLMRELVNDHRLLRHYAVNMYCLNQSPRLEARTVRLQLRCIQCNHTYQWSSNGLRSCANCLERSNERISKGLRKLNIGLLRPNVLLYGKDGDTFLDDVEERPDLVLVAGMSPASESIRSLVEQLGGKIFWVSKEKPSSKLKPLFDYVYQGDCDAIARLYNLKPRPHRLTYNRLCEYDDKLTDVLVDHALHRITVRKACKSYRPLNLDHDDVISILRENVIRQRNFPEAMSQILKLPGLKQYSESFRSPNELEDFHCHMEKYLAIYLPDCPFKILSTYRYSFEQQAMIVARKRIVRGEEIRYLCGTTVSLHKDELAVLKQNGSNFSIIESKWKGSTSLMLGPLRFVNHSKKPNARLNLQRAIITAIKDIEPCQEITASYGHEYFGPHNQDCVREIHPQQNHGSNSMPNRKRAVGQISSNPQKEHSAKRVKR